MTAVTGSVPTAAVQRARASFWTCAAVLGLALWASGAATPVYPLYGSTWRLTPTVTTAIFAVYPLVLVIVLLVFGDLSDAIGRRRSILAGIVAAAIGALLFAVAPSVGWVLLGRAFMGIGVGLSLSPATAAMTDLAGPAASGRTSAIATASTAGGLTIATLLGGALVEYGPMPLHLAFWVLLAAEVVVLGLVWRLPDDRDPSSRRWRPCGIRVPRSLAGVVVAAAACVSAAYCLGAVVLSLGADIGESLIGTSNAFVVGAAVAVSSVAIGVVAILARRVPPAIAGAVGGVLAAIALAVLVLAGSTHSLALFAVFSVVGGAGYSLLFGAGLGIVGRFAPSHHRAGTLSTVYLVAYLLQGATALWLGAEATAGGLGWSVDLALPAVGGFGLLALVLVLVLARPRRA
jgi:MFS family permease